MSARADDDETVIVAVVGDLHVNSTVGLCPPYVDLDDGGTYRPSKAQRWLWRCWLDFWNKIGALKREHGAQCYAVLNGDLADDNRHSKHQLITPNNTTVIRMTAGVLEPALDVADRAFVVRGTEAHAGPSAQLDEKVAEDIDAERNEEAKTWSWWWLPLEAAGVRFDIAHHPQTFGSRPWTLDPAAARHAVIIRDQYWERGERPPDVAVRSHVHTYSLSAKRLKPQFFYTPPWELTTAHGHRRGGGGGVEPVGGLPFVCQNGEYTFDKPISYRARRQPPWKKT